jgi:hypothetical protein
MYAKSEFPPLRAFPGRIGYGWAGRALIKEI